MICFDNSRTKWKRQNQVRLDQLRQHSNAENSLVSRHVSSGEEGDTECCQIYRGSADGPGCSFFPAAAAILRSVTYVHGCSL